MLKGRTWIGLLIGAVLVAVALTAGFGAARRSRPPTPRIAAAPSIAACLKHTGRPCLTPAEIRAAYGIDTVLRRGITGKGRTIAVIVSFGSPTLRSDLHAFDRAFGLPDPRLDVLAPLGKAKPSDTGWEGETTLDVEWAHAVAPGARIVVLESPVDETEGVQGLPQFLKLEQYAVRHHLADVISQSWAATEDTLFDRAGRAMMAQFHRFYASATARGVSIVCASGDEGAAGPDRTIRHLFPYRVVQFPADDPLVLAIGGTRLAVDLQGRVHGETAWSGSGGGVSKVYPEPAYQRLLPATTQALLGGHRGIPDVAYNAATDSPILVYEKGQWASVGGTSAATPQWAGILALADQAAGHDLGAIHSTLYRLAVSSRYQDVLRDVTQGGIAGPGHTGAIAYRAGPGWDAATGLGSPRVPGLIAALKSSSQ